MKFCIQKIDVPGLDFSITRFHPERAMLVAVLD